MSNSELGSFNIFEEHNNTKKDPVEKKSIDRHENTPKQESMDDSSIHSSDAEHDDTGSNNSSSTSFSDAESEDDKSCNEEKIKKPFRRGKQSFISASSWLDIGPNRGMYF